MDQEQANEQVNELMLDILTDLMDDKHTMINEFCRATSAYQLSRIADSLDRLCSIFKGGIYTYPS